MVIAIFLNIKLADIPPESNRSRTLYPLFGFYTKSLAESGRSFDMRYSTAALDSCFRQLKCVESATGVTEAFLIVDDEAQQHSSIKQPLMPCVPTPVSSVYTTSTSSVGAPSLRRSSDRASAYASSLTRWPSCSAKPRM